MGILVLPDWPVYEYSNIIITESAQHLFMKNLESPKSKLI